MAFDKLLLIDLLRDLSIGDHRWADDPGLEDRIRAVFLVASTHSPTNCQAVDRLGYETYTDDRTGSAVKVRGLSLKGPGCLLTDVVEGLMGAEEVPPELSEWVDSISLEDYRAALFAVLCVLNALQWSQHDEKKPRSYGDEDAERAVASSLRSLVHFRDTGEP